MQIKVYDIVLLMGFASVDKCPEQAGKQDTEYEENRERER